MLNSMSHAHHRGSKKAFTLVELPAVSKTERAAFTLVELLVVIGIIALLISVLLPALGRARRAAYTVSCLANLRSIGQAMNMYASENKGWLPGSGWTSGAQFYNLGAVPPTAKTYTDTNCPTINEANDWIGPLTHEMGIKNPGIDGTDIGLRYKAYRELKFMICPAYSDMPVGNKTPGGITNDPGLGQGLSYCISLCFMDRAWDAVTRGITQPSGTTALNGGLIVPLSGNSKPIVQLPADYGPKLSKVHNSGAKVFASDGGRSVIPVGGVVRPPVYVVSGDPSNTNWDNTSYADVGAFGGYSHSVYRIAVPGNATATPPTDVRVWVLRHGTLKGFQATGTYRMNVVYFDGHAETLDEVQASNPALWMPTGSVIYPTVGASGSAVAGTKTVWSDVQARYCPGVTSNSQSWTAP